MRIHILGICGTFMGSLALIARQLGHEVSGSDENVYPPMGTQLEEQGITLFSGFSAEIFSNSPDLVIVGNVIKRGNPAIEHILNERIPFISGPQWLYENILKHRTVLAVSGTHGKTTTTAMLAWILQCAKKNPGFLIGGVPKNFNASAELGESPYFVIEADEYDTAFFDKRSKFIHYFPTTLIINNIEFDHGDIFPDLEAIKKQFALLLRGVPSSGQVIFLNNDQNIADVFNAGCWSDKISFGDKDAIWHAKNISATREQFDVYYLEKKVGSVNWSQLGEHNIRNAIAAIAAANQIGISPEESCNALKEFAGIKRRLEIRGKINDITIYDDFAHHPTAIAATVEALRAKVGNERIIALVELGSNTMRAGMHGNKVITALQGADTAIILRPTLDLNLDTLANKTKVQLLNSVEEIVAAVIKIAKPHDHILIMSNKNFGGIHQKLKLALGK